MSKRRNIFKGVQTDTEVTRSSLFKEAYKINNLNTCPAKEHKNNKHNPWCLHGLGQDNWLKGTEGHLLEEQHFSVRPKFMNKYSGLRNLGATCYVNSLIQVLFYNTSFRSALYQYKPPSNTEGDVIRTLQQLFVLLQHSTRGVIDTTDLVTALQLPTTEQQDVVEFGELLFGLLNNSIPGLQKNNKGSGSYVTRCLTCGNTTTRSSQFTDLKLQVQPKNKTLVDRIGYLTAVEVLEGENSYYCCICNTKRTVERGYVLDRLPATLQLQLLRFNYNTTTGQRTKDSSFVKFNDVLTLQTHQDARTYQLSSVIIHVGDTTQSGHYIAHIRRAGVSTDRWITFNDEVCSESPVLDLKQYDLTNARRPTCGPEEHCSQSVYMLVYNDITTMPCIPDDSASVSTLDQFYQPSAAQELSSCTSPPPDLLSKTIADNEDFMALRDLLQEQEIEVRCGRRVKEEEMRDICCRLHPPDDTHFIPLPTDMLKNWLLTGEVTKFPEGPDFFEKSILDKSIHKQENGEKGCRTSEKEVKCLEEKNEKRTSEILCTHKKLSYHNLTDIKFINNQLYSELFASYYNELGIEPEGRSPSNTIHCNGGGLEPFVLCRECVVDDLKQHLADRQLEQDYNDMVEMQGVGAETGWWVWKLDFKHFKRLVRQADTARFNSDVECEHGNLQPDVKARKLVSTDIICIVKKHIAEFPILMHDTEPCSVCTEESSSEKIYFSQLLSMRRDLNRLLTDSIFPYIPNLTPYIVPIKFIRWDLQPLYKKKLEVRINLDNTPLICKHSLLASDALEHAAFVKESEWTVISTHFGPTTTLRCDTLDTGVVCQPGICGECVMQHDAYVDQMIYLREDRAPGKRGRRGDKVLYISSNNTVHDVKVKICRKLAVAPSEQTLSTLSGRVLEYGTMQEHGVLPGSILYLDYTHVVCEETEIFDTVVEQGFKGTVLSQ